MFKRHLERILTVFVHRLTNSFSVGINNKVQSLIKKAYGYRNRERFKTDIFSTAVASTFILESSNEIPPP